MKSKIENELIIKFSESPTIKEIEIVRDGLASEFGIGSSQITFIVKENFVLMEFGDFQIPNNGGISDGIVTPPRVPLGPKGPKIICVFNTTLFISFQNSITLFDFITNY